MKESAKDTNESSATPDYALLSAEPPSCRQRALRLQALLHVVDPHRYRAPAETSSPCEFAFSNTPGKVCDAVANLTMNRAAVEPLERTDATVGLAAGQTCPLGPLAVNPSIDKIAREQPSVFGGVHVDLLTTLERQDQNRRNP